MSKYKVFVLFSLLGLIINFNLFVQTPWAFTSSLLLFTAVNFTAWKLISFLCGRYLKSKDAGNWIGGVVVFLLSIYGYGLNFFPSWVSDNPLADSQWRNSMKELYKAIFAGSLIVLPVAIFFISRKERGRAFLNAFLISALVIVSANKVWSYYKTYHLFAPQQMVKAMDCAPAGDTIKPDIYYFVLDGYTGNTALKNYWNFDNSDFTRKLNELDFKVADSARGNIAATIGAMSAVFNLSAFNHPELYEYNMDLIIRTRIWDNALFRLLNKNGYTVSANSIFFDPKPFFFSQGEMHPNAVFFSNFLTRHLLFRLALKGIDKFTGYTYIGHNWFFEYDKRIHESIASQISMIGKHPGFYYNHLMTTHPIYRYTETGEPLDLDKRMSDTSNYLDQVRYTNTLCLDYFSRLITAYRKHDKPVVIIAQSDHGSKELREINEESQIQLMIYDSQGKINIRQQEDGINLMRKVAGTYLGCPLSEQPYNYYDVFKNYR